MNYYMNNVWTMNQRTNEEISVKSNEYLLSTIFKLCDV